MARIELLNTEAHRATRVLSQADPRHFERIVASEFALAAAHYPILFAKDSETGAFFAGAVLGFHEGENLFLRNGRQTSYRPLGTRRGPFFISGENLALDLDDPRIGHERGEMLFDEAGEPSPFLKDVQATLTKLKIGVEQTSAFIKVLLRLELIEPIDISLSFDDGTRCRLDGLYTISSDALNELADEDVLALFRSGHLQLAHCVIGSLRQIPVLARARNERLLDVA